MSIIEQMLIVIALMYVSYVVGRSDMLEKIKKRSARLTMRETEKIEEILESIY